VSSRWLAFDLGQRDVREASLYERADRVDAVTAAIHVIFLSGPDVGVRSCHSAAGGGVCASCPYGEQQAASRSEDRQQTHPAIARI